MTLAYFVYFGLLVLLAICWMPAMRASVTGSPLVWHESNKALVASVALFTLLIGGRYGVGGDFFGYIDYYRYSTLQNSIDDVVFEPGFLYLIKLLKLFYLPERSIIFASSFIQILAFAIWLRRRPEIAPFAIYTFFTTLLLLDVNNIVRQGIALFILLIALDAVNDRRLVRFVMLSLLAYLFHRSALIMLPIGLLAWGSRLPPIKAQIAALLLTYSFVDALVPQFGSLFSFLSPLVGYDGYSDVSRADLSFEGNQASFGLGLYFWPVIDVLIILYSARLADRYSEAGYRIYHLLFLIAAVMQPIAIEWNFLPFSRALFYFGGMRMICLAFLLRYCLVDSRKLPDVLTASAIMLALLAWFVIALSRGAAWSTPYQF